MNKKYIKYQIKQWLPLIGIISGILIITLIIDLIFSKNPMNYHYYEASKSNVSYQNPLIITSCCILCLTFFVPLFVFSYKYSIKKADTYVQSPFKNNNLKITNFILGYLCLALPFIVIFLIGLLSTYITQLINNPYHVIVVPQNPGMTYYSHITFYYNYGYLILFMFFILFMLFIEYSLNSFAANFANNTIDALIYISLFFIFRMLILYAIPQYFMQNLDIIEYDFNIFNLSLTIMPVISFALTVFNSLISRGYFDAKDVFISDLYKYQYVGYVISFTFIIMIGIFAALYIFFIKDKYKENYGRKRNNTIFDYLLPHLTMMFIAFSLYTITRYDTTSKIVIFLAFFVMYYCLLASLNKSFKIKKYDLIFGGAISLVNFCLFIASITIEHLYL